MDVSIHFIIESFLASSLIMCFSFGFILIDLGFKIDTDISSEKNILFRYLGMIMILIAFGCVLLIIQDINMVYV